MKRPRFFSLIIKHAYSLPRSRAVQEIIKFNIKNTFWSKTMLDKTPVWWNSTAYGPTEQKNVAENSIMNHELPRM